MHRIDPAVTGVLLSTEQGSMSMRAFVEAVRDDPGQFVQPVDPLYLGAFFSGCVEANAALRPAIRTLLDTLPGPSGADPWSRAYLLHPSDEAVRLLLDSLCQTIPEDGFEAGWSASTSCIDAVRDAVEQGRWGMALGQCSVLWLSNFIGGFHAALRWWLPERAQAEEGRLRAFETWLAARYGQQPVPTWDRLLRVYEGEGQSGVERFVELWATWQKDVDARTRGSAPTTDTPIGEG
jgi:hypothetical protein